MANGDPPPGQYGGQQDPQGGQQYPQGGQQYPQGGQQGQYGNQPPPGQHGHQYPPGQYPQYQQSYQATGPSGPRAGFGRRLLAAIVDGLLLGIPLGIIGELIGVPLFTFKVAINETTGQVGGLPTASLGTVLLFNLFTIAVGVAYYGYFEGGASGQTLGKRALGIRVISQDTGGPLGAGRAIGRYFARALSALACLLGYLWMLWDREKQTWHDKLTTSVVVPIAAYPVQR